MHQSKVLNFKMYDLKYMLKYKIQINIFPAGKHLQYIPIAHFCTYFVNFNVFFLGVAIPLCI
jgi:hypothetical protein